MYAVIYLRIIILGFTAKITLIGFDILPDVHMSAVICRLPNHVGDCCMTLPALHLLEESGFTPVLVGKGWGKALFSGMGWRYEAISGKTFKDVETIRSVKNSLPKDSRALLFPNSLGSALSFRLAGIKPTGFPTDGRGILLDERIPEPPVTHEVKRFFELTHSSIRSWGAVPKFNESPESLNLKLSSEHEAIAEAIVDEHSLEKFAILAPVAKGLHHGKCKEWPHFNELAVMLKKSGTTPVVIPTPDEEAQAKKTCPEALFLSPVNLGVFAALCKRAEIVVANDSGVSHVAAAVGANQLTLIGVTDIERTSPWSPKAVVLGENGRWPTLKEATDVVFKQR